MPWLSRHISNKTGEKGMDEHGPLVGLLVLCLSTSAHAEVDLKEHISNNDFNDIKISTDGEAPS